VLGGCVCDSSRQQEDDDDDQDLTREHPAPRRVGGEQSADERAGSHGDRAGRRNQSVRTGPRISGEIGRDERNDRREDQDRTEALEQ
jgi:hypothetical protein